MWSSTCLPIVSLSLEFETVTAFGLGSWVNCVWLLVSDSLDFSWSGTCFQFPFICLPLWLMVSGSPRASLHSLYLSPSLAFRRLVVSGSPDVSLHLSPLICFPLWPLHLGWCCLALRVFPFTCLPSCVSHSG